MFALDLIKLLMDSLERIADSPETDCVILKAYATESLEHAKDMLNGKEE